MPDAAHANNVVVACPHCHTLVRVPADRLKDNPTCGRCKSAVVTGQPVKLDTAAFVRSPAPKFNIVQTERGMSMTSTINPLPEVDDWAILPDGTIAILRKDYHVDYVDASGQKTSAPKIPFGG